MRRSSNGLGKQTFNLCNVGSTPIRRTNYGPLAQLVEQPTLNRLVAGSIPARSTIWNITTGRWLYEVRYRD
jgi:hypothetical protein